MAINFPDAPSVDDEFTAADKTWIWNGTTWKIASSSVAHAPTHASGGSDAVTLAQSQVTNLTTDLAGKSPLAGS
tara:strand:+ start:5624 stop:5845 length:222 start_codon:yes stop_codon:yes gene_type:complete